MLCNVFCSDAVATDEFVQRRQGGGQLRTGDDFGIPGRDKRLRTARIRTVFKTQVLGLAQSMAVGLPTCRGMSLGCHTENFGKTIHRPLHLAFGPLGIFGRHMVLPADMVVAMDADLETRIAHANA